MSAGTDPAAEPLRGAHMFLVDAGPEPGRAAEGTPAAGLRPLADDGRALVHSASDLVLAAECEYRLLCRLDELLGRAPRREAPPDVMLERTAALGLRHELRVLQDYERAFGPYDAAAGRGVARLTPPRVTRADLIRAHQGTLDALHAGADVVYQAAFFDGTFHGRADFLVRADRDPDPAALPRGIDWRTTRPLPGPGGAGRTGGSGPGGPDHTIEPASSAVPAYVVVDTKLARRAKVTALLQLAAYADQLLAAGIPVAPQVSLILGTRNRTQHRIADLLPVFNARRARLVELTSAHLGRAGRAPWDTEGVRFCGRCDCCAEQIEARRDVLLAGGVYESQRSRLRAAGIATIEQLADAAPDAVPPDMSAGTFERVRANAALQLGRAEPDGVVEWHASDGPHRMTWQVVDPEAIRRLPAPSPGDIFFDFEGDPLWSDEQGESWGIDYLFGYVERPAAAADEPAPPFGAFWAHDLAAERAALIRFVDYVNERRSRYPDLHVYHYAAYERTHLLSIAARHGVYENEVDQLLRDGVLVDLYAVVRRAVRTSEKSYSIKKLEPLYMGDQLRAGQVQDAAASVVAYADYCALMDAGRVIDAGALLQQIGEYNRYDCTSTLRLLDWLRRIVGGVPAPAAVGAEAAGEGARLPAGAAIGPLGVAVPAEAGASLQPVGPRAAEAMALEEEIRAVVGEDRAARDADRQALARYGASIGYYRREAKPFWHEHYSRLVAPPDEWLGRRNAFLVESARVLTDWEVEPGKRSLSRRLELVGRLPEGTDLRDGAEPYLIYDPPCPPCAKVSSDAPRGWLTGGRITGIERRPTPTGECDVVSVREQLPGAAEPFDHLPMALTPAPGPPTRPQEDSVEVAARRAFGSFRTGGLPDDAVTDLLRRTPPRLVGGGALPPVVDGDVGAAILAAVRRLDRSYLAVQGPPGTGKTYVGSHVVARLVADGWTVAVVAQSHAVVENMLCAVVRAGVPAERVAKKLAADGPSPTAPCRELDGRKLAAFAGEEGGRVVGGTAWDFAAPRFPVVDLLVIDEAGQFSVANTVAVGRCARRLLLLGDPQQLPQVSQGTHPEPVDASALGMLTDGHEVLPTDLGYFLPATRRMHPDLARAVSRLAYDDALSAHPVAAARSLAGVAPGVEVVLLPHEGNAVASVQEAAEVVRRVRALVGRAWTDPGSADPAPAAAAGTDPGSAAARPLAPSDILVVAAYNAQVWTVRRALAEAGLAGVGVGTVDKFQGREAPVVIVTLAASSAASVPRGLGFLLNRNRINVAISRAQWAAVVIRSPDLTDYLPHTVQGLTDLGAFLGLAEPRAGADVLTPSP